MDLSFASKAAEAKAQIADALKRMPPVGPLGAPPAPVPPQGGPQAPAPQGAPPQAPAAPMSPLAAIGMQRPPMPPQQPPQAPNLAVPRAFAKGGRVRNQMRSLAVQFKGN